MGEKKNNKKKAKFELHIGHKILIALAFFLILLIFFNLLTNKIPEVNKSEKLSKEIENVKINNVEREKITNVSLTETATIEVSPDLVNILFTIETSAKIAKDAVEENARLFVNIKNGLRKLNINDENIMSLSYNIVPVYETVEETTKEGRRYKNILIGYKTTHQVKIITKNFSIAGKIIDEISKNNNVTIDSIYFSLTRESEDYYKEKVLDLAVKKALRKINVLEKSLNKKLKNVAVVNVVSSIPIFYDYQGKVAINEAMPTEILPKKLEIKETVNLIVELSS
jgi:uncharacterized protein YggE